MPKITGFGTYVPERIIDNHYYEQKIDTSDEWIVTRTGIKERRFAQKNEYVSDLCVKAIKKMQTEGHNIQDIDFILVCTTSPDQTMPNTASRIQNKLNIKNAGCIDVYAACAGFVYGLQLANGLIMSGAYKKVLVCASETLSKITDFEDRTSCILFGDGAGVALVEPSDKQQFIVFNSGTEGEYGKDLYLSNSKKTLDGIEMKTNGKIIQNGKSVFKWAIASIPKKIRDLLTKANMRLEDIDYIIPHSANIRILDVIVKDIQCPPEKILESITYFGNTSSASIPLAIDQAIKTGKIKKGHRLLLIGFGGGLTFAGTILEW